MKVINYSEKYISDPERYEEGQKLFEEIMTKFILDKIYEKRKTQRQNSKEKDESEVEIDDLENH